MSRDEADYYAREGRLQPRDAVVAVILLEDGRYLMQLRDQKPGIFFPGHLGFFGGAIDEGEETEGALRRELREELTINVESMKYFTQICFDFSPHGFGKVLRTYYEVKISRDQEAAIRLGEGTAFQKLDSETLLRRERVTPYDAFVVWMHTTR